LKNRINKTEAIGLVPAGGRATRISPLPCSKELYPIGYHASDERENGSPKVACHYLLEKMQTAGIATTYIVLRKGKWDIPAYFMDGQTVGMRLAYLMVGLSYGVPFTLDHAYPFVKDKIVAFGFPDILFQPKDAFTPLLDQATSSRADVLLGLFPAEMRSRVDMVDVDHNGRVRSVLNQSSERGLHYSWCIAVWSPQFTEFQHRYVGSHAASAGTSPEISLGQVFQAAIEEGLEVAGLEISKQPFLDIGTPENLRRAITIYNREI
jgi:glucose-1-phosphate thymidylyltransferase